MLSAPFSLRRALRQAGGQMLLRAEFGLAVAVMAVAATVFALMAAYLGLRPVVGPAGAAALLALACFAIAALITLGLNRRPDAVVPAQDPQTEPEVTAESAAFLLAFVLARRLGRD